MASDKQREEWRNYNRRRRTAARKEGICSRCLSRPVIPGRSQCRTCRHARTARAREILERDR